MPSKYGDGAKYDHRDAELLILFLGLDTLAAML